MIKLLLRRNPLSFIRYFSSSKEDVQEKTDSLLRKR